MSITTGIIYWMMTSKNKSKVIVFNTRPTKVKDYVLLPLQLPIMQSYMRDAAEC
jgi:hypothetical protein